MLGPLQSSVGFPIIWDVINNRPVFQREEILQMQQIAFSPGGNWLATEGSDGTIVFWDVTGNREPVTVQSQTTPVYDLTFYQQPLWLPGVPAPNPAKFWDSRGSAPG